MKYFFMLMIVAVAVTAQEPSECRGPWCPIQCPPGTYRYSVGCDYRQPEPTCTNPTPAKETVQICDYQACYCSPPTVRDETTKTCVKLEDCDSAPVTWSPCDVTG